MTSTIDDYRRIQRVRLTDKHRPTGRTRHYAQGEMVSAPAELQIVQIVGESGYYLLYLDEEGHELTDTYHDTLDRAVQQAHWEFHITENEWEPFA